MSAAPSYWCYRCSRLVRVGRREAVICPDCNGGFVEQIGNVPRSLHVHPRRRRFPAAAAMYMMGQRLASDQNSRPTLRRSRRNGGDRSPFNPVIVLRGTLGEAGGNGNGDGGEGRGFELYYDDDSGSGLRPLPPSMSEFLLGSGFERLLEQLSNNETSGVGRYSQPPASKSAIESLPTVEINEGHLEMESHCAVCKDQFEPATTARELPCKHIFHQGCILPWLDIRNSCPVCRYELPADPQSPTNHGPSLSSNEDENTGLTIWRLPRGGYAVGRFSGSRRGTDRELPVVYTEMDGGFNNGGEPRRISWSSRGNREMESSGFGRMIRNLFSCFRATRSAVSVSTAESPLPRRSRPNSYPNTAPNSNSASRRRRTWSLDGNSGSGMRDW